MIIRQIAQLQQKNVEELREMYKGIFLQDAPSNASINFLKPKIAYRIQELALGGLSEQVVEKLQKIAKGSHPERLNAHLTAGVKLYRDYKGIKHEVRVKKEGFEYKGKDFVSLTAIARQITDTRCSGPKFFGVKS